MVFVFYTLCLMVMLIIRPVLSSKLMPNRGKSAIYSALYFLPALIVVHAIAAGLICEYNVTCSLYITALWWHDKITITVFPAGCKRREKGTVRGIIVKFVLLLIVVAWY